MGKIQRSIVSLLTSCLFLLISPVSSIGDSTPDFVNPDLKAHLLFRAGKIADARSSFESGLKLARKKKDKAALWRSLMGIAWFEDEVGQFRKSIEYSNEALEVANALKHPFMIGRSLCWLGWAYSSLGLYELALDFYEQAVELGAPDGAITIVPVWGLATQEMGAIYFKMGDTASALKLLTETTEFGRKRGIDIALAEGSAHLSEIYLHTGKFQEAQTAAEEAYEAAKRCACSPFNTARALVARARVAFHQAERNPEVTEKVQTLLEKTAESVAKTGHARLAAEIKLLLSRLLTDTEWQLRHDLVQEAFKTLSEQESELRGLAEAELGRVYIEGERRKLAEFYTNNGLRVSEELFRKVDTAYLLHVSADLEALQSDKRAIVDRLVQSFDTALSTDALPLALRIGEKLYRHFAEEENWGLALKWARKSLTICEKLYERNEAAAFETEEHFFERRTELRSKVLEFDSKLRYWS